MAPVTRKSRDRIEAILKTRILVVDGAMGTTLQGCGLSAEDFGGPEYEGCNEHLVLTRPDIIEGVHRSFLEAGADVIETDTFGSTAIVLAEYGLAHKARAISRVAAEIARGVADAFSTPGQPRFVAGSMGPTTKTISVTGGVTWDELAASFQEQALGLIEGGVDFLLVETAQDTLNIKAALEGIDRANAELGTDIPVAVQGTVETMGTLLAGQDIEALYVSLAHRDLLWVGLNCATGPDFMTDHIRTLAAISRFPVACIPNAGLPDEDGRYNETPQRVAAKLAEFADAGWLNVVGGCCGTVARHIACIADAMRGKPPRVANPPRRSVISGIEAYEIEDEKRPVLVGERTNVLGSRKFKRLVAEGKLDEAAEIGRAQTRKGAAVLDVCLQDPDRHELADVIAFLELLVKKVKAPVMIDSTDPLVVEEALKRLQGKAVINSINLEDGEEKFERITPLARRFGAALVVGCIDDDPQQAQAVTRERKLAVARRSFDLLTTKYGIAPEDVYFDPLVFPCGTGDATYSGSGVETIEGIRLIKAATPLSKTILGISNVSFGLPQAGREVLNSVFLHHCVEAGLDLAIVNTEALAPYSRISEEDKKICDDLLFWRGADPIAAFAAHFAAKRQAVKVDERSKLGIDERLALNIIEGSREGLFADLDEKLRTQKPLDIINGPLMAGMDEVGRRFNANEMIVAEVLQSAEAMKAAVAHLEPHMEKAEASSRGTVVLATVKGDVHDIGKNLVEIILANNGFRVINLGIKVPPEDLIAAYREHRPDAIGLSGLLVKSAQQMVTTARDLAVHGIRCPVLVGGAALSNRFTRLRIAPAYPGIVAYAQDAMTGLDLAKKIVSEAGRDQLTASLAREDEKLADAAARKAEREAEVAAPRVFAPPRLTQNHAIPIPPDLRRHVLGDYDLEEIFPYINPLMLYTRHLGFKGSIEKAVEQGDARAIEVRNAVEQVENEMLRRPEIRARAVYRFFPAQSDGETLLLLDADFREVIGRFHFGRQQRDGGLCLADYVAPRASRRRDYLALFVTTVGPIRPLADQWKNAGEYLKSHVLQALALESAEAFSELLHKKIREMWGFPDPDHVTMKELFQAKYRGIRVSFGYPACPRLDDQVELFRLLDATAEIGVELTEGFMMDPESSVSAMVFHHPEARYFSLTEADQEHLATRIAAGGG
jgi:5-methyltetrahydrofolate--homocysteine methyltransferase